MNISEIESKGLDRACNDYQVKSLSEFGSAVTVFFSENRDLDF